VSKLRVVIVGGGAAGFFAAITCAETFPDAKVTVLEKGPKFLSKVRISGGGRCNVTHACFDPRELSLRYPRGGKALLAAYHTFQARETIAWFAARGVELKTEADGRMFPVTDSSETIIECLMHAADTAGVELVCDDGVEHVSRNSDGKFQLTRQRGGVVVADRLMLATGGCRSAAAGSLAVALGHSIEPPVPSLFTFHAEAAWIRALAGISIADTEVSVPSTRLRERGPVLLTHAGLSGPAILRLSAWGARDLHQRGYKFPLHLNWLPTLNAETLGAELDSKRARQPARLIVNTPVAPLAARLWEALVLAAGIPRETRWAELSRAGRHGLVQTLSRTELQVIGKTLNQDEFVTCGGVRLSEVNFKTMESRLCPGLYFGGELLDIDGITGGFNFQSAWTTGWVAGKAMGRPSA
jgi:predicted Rossmann fold flavoprotein